jgi:hypothetical protein
MALPNIYIELVRDGLGLVVETNDNICGLIVPGTAIPGTLDLNTPYAIYSLNGAKDLGIDPAVEPGNAVAYRHIKEFYSVAEKGRKLWIIIVNQNTTISQSVDGTFTGCPAKLLLDKAQGEIVALGVTANIDTGVTIDGLDGEVYSAMLNGQLLADEYQTKIMPFVCVIEGRRLTDVNSLRDLGTETRYRQAIVLASTQTDGSASVGLVLGQIAALPVQRKISRVKNGALPIEVGYLSDGVAIREREDLDTIHDKRYIIFRTFPNKSGFFFNGDPTATAQTDDLNIIARIRTIDKAMKIAYNTYVEEIDDDVELNDDGTLHSAVAAYLKDKIETQVNGAMKGEISKFTATVDTSINIASGAEQAIYLDILPKGYLTNIRVVLGFKVNS